MRTSRSWALPPDLDRQGSAEAEGAASNALHSNRSSPQGGLRGHRGKRLQPGAPCVAHAGESRHDRDSVASRVHGSLKVGCRNRHRASCSFRWPHHRGSDVRRKANQPGKWNERRWRNRTALLDEDDRTEHIEKVLNRTANTRGECSPSPGRSVRQTEFRFVEWKTSRSSQWWVLNQPIAPRAPGRPVSHRESNLAVVTLRCGDLVWWPRPAT